MRFFFDFPSPLFPQIPLTISTNFPSLPQSNQNQFLLPQCICSSICHGTRLSMFRPVIWNTCTRHFWEMASSEFTDWVFDYGAIEDIPVPGGDLPSLDLPAFTLPSRDFTASFRFFFFRFWISFWLIVCRWYEHKHHSKSLYVSNKLFKLVKMNWYIK